MLGETLRARYRCALIDEFQDTDAVQWRIFRRLFVERATPHFLYVIGDPKQAIYAFRGADVYTYLDARDAIEQAGGARVALDTNYRATPAMIDALNHLFGAHAPEGHFFTGRIQYDTPVRCGHPDWMALGPSGDRGAPLHILQLMPESTPLSAALIRRAFGRHIAGTIARLLQPGGGLRLRQGDAEQPVRARDIFILTHTASEGGEIGQYLRAEGVPYVFYKQEGLMHTPEALAICDVLSAVAAPHGAAVRIKAWATPFFAVPLHQLADCQSLPGSHPLMQQLLRWKALGEQRDFDALFADMLNTSGWLRRELLFQSGMRELTNVQHLFEILLEETRRSGCTLPELVQTLQGWINGTRRPPDDAGQMQRLTSEPDAVQIMTMHKSKGLEAAVVFCYGGLARRPDDAMDVYHEGGTRVVGLASDPAAKAAARQEIAEEEQRLLYVALTRAKAQLYLPYIDPEHYPAHLHGCYRYLNMRLAHFLAEPEGRVHVTVDPVTLSESDVLAPSETAPPTPASLAAWQPPNEAMDTPAEVVVFDACRQRHAAFVVSSYSRMKQADGGYHTVAPPEPLPGQFNDALSRDGLQVTLEAPDENELPGGTMSGQFIHEVLEQLPLESWAPGIDFDTWRQRPDVTEVFTRGMRRYARDARYLISSQRLVYAGFTTPVSVGAGGVIPGLSACNPFRREMEFLYPIPEAGHPRLTDLSNGPLTIENGYIKGYVDFICRHAGQYYVGDWKTDRLPCYTAAHLGAHIEQNYTWQLKLYALALVKMLDIHTGAAYCEQFGGILDCFLRGMAEPGTGGVFYVRPSWDDMLSYEDELRRRQSYV